MVIRNMTENDKSSMMKKLTTFSEKYDNFFPDKLVEEIRNTK